MWHNHNQAVSIGPGRKSEQWMRKIEQRMRKKWGMGEKKWATDQTTAAFLSIEVQPGLRYMQASLMDRGGLSVGETMLSSRQHYPDGRISQGPRVTGLEAILSNSSMTLLADASVQCSLQHYWISSSIACSTILLLTADFTIGI